MPWTRALRSSLLPSRHTRAKSVHPARSKGRPTWKPRLEWLEARTVPATFVVNTTLDDPPGVFVPPAVPLPLGAVTLRDAINSANANPGPDTINFNIPVTDPNYNGQWWTIRLGPSGTDTPLTGVPLPPLLDSGTTINGFSQPGGAGGTVGSGITPGVDDNGNNGQPMTFQRPDIAIDANEATVALTIGDFTTNPSGITIRGLSVYDSTQAAIVAAARNFGPLGMNRVVDSCFIGVLPNGLDPTILERNRGFGVRLRTDAGFGGGFLTVEECYVGFNGQGGIDGELPDSTLYVFQNEIFQNGWNSLSHDGIDLNGINGIVRYNYSHDNTNLSVVIPRGGAGNGLELGSQAPGTGNNLVEYNTFAHNLSAGISDRAGASFNTIQKNVIFDNEVGISVNTENGSVPNHTYRNMLTKNSIYMNAGLGIDLQWRSVGQWIGNSPVGPDGGNDTPATGQDHADPDTGSNDLQNYPIINTVVVTPSGTDMSGVLDSTPLTTFTIEFFATPDGTLFLTGDREGKQFIGSIQVTTDATGIATFNAHVNSQAADDDVITATATKFTGGNTPWSTSEFSPSTPVITLMEKVTGGGWYNQAANATPTPTLTDDRANFGFNAQYKKSNPVPQGTTNFHYRPADLHFLSTTYAPLSLFVVEIAPDVYRATWRGVGRLTLGQTIRNQQGYGFRADVVDAGEPGTSDTFHIKIWQEVDQDPFTEDGPVIYDNDPSSIGTILGGGNIQVHMHPNALEAVTRLDAAAAGSVLTEEVLQGVVAKAVAWWREQGVDEATLAGIADAKVLVASLSDSFLGVAANGVIGIDRDAAGYGWSTDSANPDAGRMDLFTVVTHELGHLLGLEHSDGGLMEDRLAPGVRTAPETDHLSAKLLLSLAAPDAAAVGTSAPVHVASGPAAGVTVWVPASGGKVDVPAAVGSPGAERPAVVSVPAAGLAGSSRPSDVPVFGAGGGWVVEAEEVDEREVPSAATVVPAGTDDPVEPGLPNAEDSEAEPLPATLGWLGGCTADIADEDYSPIRVGAVDRPFMTRQEQDNPAGQAAGALAGLAFVLASRPQFSVGRHDRRRPPVAAIPISERLR